MPDYVLLMKLTERGIDDIDNTPGFIDAAKRLWLELGGTVHSFHATFGEHDFVFVGEALSDYCVAGFAAAVAATGWVTTTTSRALTEDDWAYVIGAEIEALRNGVHIVGPLGGKHTLGNLPTPGGESTPEA